MFNISVRFRALSIVRRNKDEKGWEIFNLILDIASDRKKTCADKHKIYNALAVFNPAPVT